MAYRGEADCSRNSRARALVGRGYPGRPRLRAGSRMRQPQVPVALFRRKQERHAALVLDAGLRLSRQSPSPLPAPEREVTPGRAVATGSSFVMSFPGVILRIRCDARDAVS